MPFNGGPTLVAIRAMAHSFPLRCASARKSHFNPCLERHTIELSRLAIFERTTGFQIGATVCTAAFR